MNQEHKIFSPDLMFNNFVTACWCDNVENINGKLPIQTELKASGIFSIEINPSGKKPYWVFVLPINKNWQDQKINDWKSPKLVFDVVSSMSYALNVEFKSSDEKLERLKIHITNSDDWNHICCDIPKSMLNGIRTIGFSGSDSNKLTTLFKDIKILQT